jgi:nucleoside-diphosphate-sugar epimerase
MAGRQGPRLTAVTGASGFLGRQIVSALAQRGDRVRLLARDPARCGPWPGLEPEIVQGDLTDVSAMRRFAEGADAVIHCAGLISARSRHEFFMVNARGAGGMAQAVEEAAPDARLVLVSSLAAREPELSSYAASKATGEAAARKVLGEDRVLVIRPPAIYGPGDRATLPLFRMAARDRFLPDIRPADGRVALIHVEDAAGLIADLGASDATGTITLGGDLPEGYAWRDLALALAATCGRKPPFVTIPPWLIHVAAAAIGTAANVGGKPAVFSPGKARELLHANWSVTAEEMGPRPQTIRYGLHEGLAQTAAWYREHGWL